MTDFAAIYKQSRERIAELARAASSSDLDRTVPGCPRWTVADTVAHLVGVADDATAGRLAGMPTEEQTAEQVAQRRGRPMDDVLAEWDQAGARVEAAVAARKMPLNIVHDVVVHEADVRGALGAGRPPDAAWTASLDHVSRGLDGLLGRGGPITIDAGDRRFTAGGEGEAEPTTVSLEPYEFWRALFGRRSREQMAGWDWRGDPAPFLDAIPMFGPTAEPLHEPA